MKRYYYLSFFFFLLTAGCAQNKSKSDSQVKKQVWGEISGQTVDLYTLMNKQGTQIKITNYGAIIQSISVIDNKGNFNDIVLGFSTLEGYVSKNSPHFGGVVGRYANRIANAQFTLDGKTYHLSKNNGAHQIHGGTSGFDSKIWQAESFKNEKGEGVKLIYRSKDGEEGFPANVQVTVNYLLTEQNELLIAYEATTDQATVINLTQHSYFNLNGQDSGDILKQEVRLFAWQYTPVNQDFIPTGKIEYVEEDGALDFSHFHPIGERIHLLDRLPRGGYDFNYVIEKGKKSGLKIAATAYAPQTGRYLEMKTTEPGMQFYTGNFLDGTIIGKNGKAYQKHAGFCFEAQHFPDSPNHANFPTTVLRPDKPYRQLTIYKFSVK